MKQITLQPHRRGMIILDVMAGLFLLAVMATLLAVTINTSSRSAARLRDQREAHQIAQQVLMRLQTRSDLPAESEQTRIEVVRSGHRVGSMEWIDVAVIHHGRRAELTGLAPAAGEAQ